LTSNGGRARTCSPLVTCYNSLTDSDRAAGEVIPPASSFREPHVQWGRRHEGNREDSIARPALGEAILASRLVAVLVLPEQGRRRAEPLPRKSSIVPDSDARPGECIRRKAASRPIVQWTAGHEGTEGKQGSYGPGKGRIMDPRSFRLLCSKTRRLRPGTRFLLLLDARPDQNGRGEIGSPGAGTYAGPYRPTRGASHHPGSSVP